MDNILNTRNIKEANKVVKDGYSDDFNCWGATLYALNQIEELEWTSHYDMVDFLDQKTEVSKDKLIEGDILVLWIDKSRKRLEHTAVFVKGFKFWHKIGGCESEYASKKKIREIYLDAKFTEIRRLKKDY